MVGPLHDVRVLEVGRFIAAPFAGALLGDLGADVIKIEDPKGGDPMRRWQSADRPYSPQFAVYNRNKRGVALDLRTEDGREAFLRLAENADVVLENFRPGVCQRLGIDYASVAARNPQIVYASITGFGSDGPYATRAAFDTIISALSGLYSQILDAQDPRPVGPAFSDLLSGLFSVVGVVSALHGRERSGRGQHVDTSMLLSLLGFLAEPAVNYLDTGEMTYADTRQRRAQAYACLDRDGKPFVVHLSVPEKFWVALTEVLERPDLREDARFATRQDRYDNYADLDRELKSAARARTREEWSKLLEENDVPHAPILGYDEVLDDPQVRAMEVTTDVPIGDTIMTLLKPAFRLSGDVCEVSRSAPDLGEHTAEVLTEAGTPEALIDRLLTSQADKESRSR